MALTKDERRALELARESIATGESKFVCNALKKVAKNNLVLRCAEKALLAYIDQALGDCFTLLIWQDRNGLLKGANDEELRPDRLAWIDWMLGKPLPGEAVKLEWREKSDECEEAEYCGRRFLLTWADWNSRYVVTEPDAAYHVIAELPMNRRDEVDAAIVAHVWPAS